MAFVSSTGIRFSSGNATVCNRKGVIQMAHHVQKKGAKKHDRYRPKKRSNYDINRKKPEYAVNPLADPSLPPYFVVTEKAEPVAEE
mmetsp:Transcript_31808/g.123461  ORF Transcript_31808/g.123461 Transcript_31808/m.123461 type:complete len:86 (+) Transcript_31808:122-379(+)|eukprot:CAMPEP_0113970574 /NCGR_PEP_ID=MMETSP0011_2-20120614/11326_1 /TAXON_ID=101924 /ORGANISM="Rhodosorus marinus" /LENGTH=85 /DNA_ID=CAMNT_0000985113 /DNA_START=32 /DNA_END=289 /DNA_ORIENTATION=+ /assembly_acc=CAM_ASM_000156